MYSLGSVRFPVNTDFYLWFKKKLNMPQQRPVTCFVIFFCTDPVLFRSCTVHILYWTDPVLYRSSTGQILYWTDPVLDRSCTVHILYCKDPVLYTSCTKQILYCLDHVWILGPNLWIRPVARWFTLSVKKPHLAQVPEVIIVELSIGSSNIV